MLVACTMALVIFVFNPAGVRLTAASGGSGPLDLEFYYSAQEALRRVDAYGDEGRLFYAAVESIGDVIYPIVYAFGLGVLLTLTGRRAFAPSSSWRRLNALPFVILLFDYLENLSILALLWSHPAQWAGVAGLAGIFTSLKWISLGTTLAVLLASVALAIVRRR